MGHRTIDPVVLEAYVVKKMLFKVSGKPKC